MSIREIKQLPIQEINNKIIETRKKIFELKFRKATKKAIKTHLFKVYKRYLAQLLTIKHQIQ